MITILIAIVILGFLVFIHEFGHFMTAKMSGMYVEEFSIGMGPAVMQIQRGDTQYSLRLLPFGGYVRVAGEAFEQDDETEDALPPDDPRRYPNRPIWQRFLFCFAGSGMNFLAGIAIFTALLMLVGTADTDAVLDNRVSAVAENSAAQAAGIMVDDAIIRINDTEVDTWEEMSTAVQANATGAPIQVTIQRQQQQFILEVTPQYNEQQGAYLLGISKDWPRKTVGFTQAIQNGWTQTWDLTKALLQAVGKLVSGQVSITDKEEGLSGPVGIVMVIDEFAQEGALYLWSLTAMLSVNLALFNILPIPGLDGSKILFLLIEALRGKRVSPEKENIVNLVGFVLLLGLMIFITYQDILRFF